MEEKEKIKKGIKKEVLNEEQENVKSVDKRRQKREKWKRRK